MRLGSAHLGASVAPRRSVIPPVYLLAAVIVMVGLHRLLPLARIDGRPLQYAGMALMLAAGALDMWAALLFKRAGTNIRPFQPSTALVVRGPYRVTRNPMYLGMVMVTVGLALWLGSLSPWVVVPVFATLIHRRFILAEEAFMAQAFPSEYARYRARVRRWL